VLNLDDENNDDFELWSPAETRSEKCLFGRQVNSRLYSTAVFHSLHRRNITVGYETDNASLAILHCRMRPSSLTANARRLTSNGMLPSLIEHPHAHIPASEFNHMRDRETGKCVLVPGAFALPADTTHEQCRGTSANWYERTAYRKIPHSTCEGGLTLHHGTQHDCPGLRAHGFFFWTFMAVIVVGLTALFSMWWRRSPYATGYAELSSLHVITLNLTPAPFDYLKVAHGRSADPSTIPVLWPLWLPSLGSSLEWLASPGAISPLWSIAYRLLANHEPQGGIDPSLSMKTRGCFVLRMKIKIRPTPPSVPDLGLLNVSRTGIMKEHRFRFRHAYPLTYALCHSCSFLVIISGSFRMW
jgi:hypothetical protein